MVMFKIVPNGDGWGIEHDAEVRGSYATKEAAFGVVAAAASNAIKAGHGIDIEVPGSRGEEPALGAA